MGEALHFGIVVGEKSGDMLGAGLMRALRELYPGARFSGVGGPEMERLGCESLATMERLAVMGLVEPLGRLPELLRIKRRLETHFRKTRPAAFIGIDSPDFNLRLAAKLHRDGIRTVHYVSPSVWAWRKGRIHGIAKSIDLMLTLFPFETGIYHEHGVRAHCVGHPLADAIGLEDRREQARRELSLAPEAPVIALLPGSRKTEIRRMAPIFLEAAAAAKKKYPELKLLIPCSGKENHQLLQTITTQNRVTTNGTTNGTPTHGTPTHGTPTHGTPTHGTPTANDTVAQPEWRLLDDSHQAIAAADFVILASGTASLETMLLRRPMVVCYKLAPLTHAIASRIVKVDHMAIPNLLAGERLVPEYVQNEVNKENLLREIENFMENPIPHPELLRKFAKQHQLLRRNASKQAATAIQELLTNDEKEHSTQRTTDRSH